MTARPPAVSVLMPVYNCERFVRQAVASVLGQTAPDFELIVIDDGSTDGSRRIVERLARTDPRVRLISRPNAGLTRTLTEALGLARADLIARMDADDVSARDRFAKQLAYLRAHPECVAVGGRATIIDPDGWTIYPHVPPETHEELEAFHLQAVGGGIVHPAVMMRRAALDAVGGYRPEFEPAEDYDLWLRLAEVGRLHNLTDVLLRYRVHDKNVSHTRAVEQRRAVIRVLASAAERRGLRIELPPLPTEGEPAAADGMAGRRSWWVAEAMRSGHYNTARKHALIMLARRRNGAALKRFLTTLPGGHADRLLRLFDRLRGRPPRTRS
jgi:glycosyltransferase involved in cell wall biosynthesis